MNTRAYLERIAYSGAVVPDRATLAGLHRAHLLSVPFENLDIHLGRPIVLDEARFFAKIVGARRGGFCYELNGLFAALLRAAGFGVTLLSAGVAGDAGRYSPDFDHLALMVEADGRFLVDVGFGEGFLDPLPFDGRSIDGYRLERDWDTWTLLRGDRPRYRFTLRPRKLGDFAARCRYHQSSPESHFRHGRIVTRATADGRITLTDTKLIVARAGEREERTVEGADQFWAQCEAQFGISALKE